MTDTPIICGGTRTLPSTSVTQYTAPTGTCSNWAITESAGRIPVPAAGKFSNLYINTDTDPTPGSYTFTLYKNGSPTALTCALTPGNTTASDTTHSVTFAAGDTISIECVPSGTPTTLVALRIGALHISTAVGESFLLSHTAGAGLGVGVTVFTFAQGISDGTTPETSVAAIVPTGGTVSELWLRSDNAPGAAQSVTYTLVKNGTDTAQTTSISGASQTTNSDLVHPISFSAGDTISLKVVTTAGISAQHTSVGLKWVPTIDGESLLLYANSNSVGSNQTRYSGTVNGAMSVNATESNVTQVAPCSFALKKFFARLEKAPTANTLTFTDRVNASSVGCPTFVITGASVFTGSDISTIKNVVAGDKIALQQISSVGISSGYVGTGSVAYIVPHYGMSSKMMSMGIT